MKYARALKWIGIIACVVVLMALLGATWMWNRIEASLPVLDGELTAPGIGATAEVARDEIGVAVITAGNRSDAMYALGVAHGQDRFFQMDLSRRNAAGRLSQLFGEAALPLDRATVVHRFSDLSNQVLAQLPPAQVALLQAYTAGVNTGLQSLPQTPWEYAVLRGDPEPWEPRDCVLVFYAMVLELQKPTGVYEQTLSTLRDVMAEASVDYFNPVIGPNDSTFDGTTRPLRAVPSERILDLRPNEVILEPEDSVSRFEPAPDRLTIGSNAFVVTGAQTEHGAGLLAGDPHLGLKVPNTWYRAQLNYGLEDGSPHRVEGVSLPGVPGIIIGSNGHIAWTHTNATVDTGDLVPIDLNQVAPEILYYVNGESEEFEERVDVITLKNGDTEEVESTWTIHGPIVARTVRGKSLAHKWTFHDPAAVNFDVLDLGLARDVDQALAIAAKSGMPNQNMFVVDRTGAAAWALTGKLPKRLGYDGRFPVSWTFGDRGWDGYLTPAERPVRRAAPGEVLWSGNQRKVGGEELARIGDDGFDEPYRAAQIESRLRDLAGQTIEPADLLAIQLDNEAFWAKRWAELLKETLRQPTGSAEPARTELLAMVESWDGRAALNSAAYRFIRRWHRSLASATLEPIFAKSRSRDPGFRYSRLRYDEALWELHRDEPLHLLAPPHRRWADLRQSVARQLIEEARDESSDLTDYTWGDANRLSMRHPLSYAVPGFIGQFLDMTPDQQDGDARVPRVARPTHGASLRFVVAPGQEPDGIMQLPGGQSGNPLSPYYRAGHQAWLRGDPTPFQPGEVVHRLKLNP